MEKHPKKRAYDRGKLREVLSEMNLYEAFKRNCKEQDKMGGTGYKTRGAKELNQAFSWVRAGEGFTFWEGVNIHWENFKHDGILPEKGYYG